MIDLKKIICSLLLIFSVASMCRGNVLLDQTMAVVEEKFERRISNLERNNLELVTEVQALRLLSNQTQYNINATNEMVEDKFDDLKEEVRDLSDFTNIVNMPESCGHLKLMGDSKSKTLLVKPDGENSNEAPIKVFCQLPQGVTTVGEAVEVKVGNCPEPHCFPYKMPYTTNDMDQIKNLIERSSVCTQRITIKCMSAPLQFDGVDFFYWIDQSGSNHSFREIGNSTICDEKEPTLLQETAEVSSKEMLPLTGFSYGPISYENQELSVKIGELICQPNMELEESFLIKNQFSELRNEINSTKDDVQSLREKISENTLPERIAIEEAKRLDEEAKRLERLAIEEANRLCLTQYIGYYKILDNQCFYFETEALNFDSANKNCQEKLGASARLYEPKSVSEMKKVATLGDEVFIYRDGVWLGVTDKRIESQFAYNSNGLPVNFTPPWYSDYGSKGKGNDCIIMGMTSTSSSFTKWGDLSCTHTSGSICQSNL